MGLADFFKGGQHKARALELELQVSHLHQQCERTETELSQLKDKYLKLLNLAKTFSALDAAEIDQEIDDRKKHFRNYEAQLLLPKKRKERLPRISIF